MTVTNDFDLPGDGTEPPAATGQQQQSGGQLRKQLEDTLAAKKALEERLTALETERRTTTLQTLVKDAGLPEAAAARYPADAEVTPEKITAWAEAEKAYALQLSGQPAGTTTAPPGTPVPPVGVTPEAQAAMTATAAAAAGAPATEAGLEAMYARLKDPSVSWPQLQKEMAAMGFQSP